MAHEGLHEPAELLDEATIDRHRALESVIEELEAIDWYQQRADACTDPAIMRVALLDAPAVLGWQEWRRISERHGMGLVSFGLQNAMDAGVLAPRPVAPLAHLLMGAMSEAAMVIVNADDPAAAREEIEPPLVALLDGLRQHD